MSRRPKQSGDTIDARCVRASVSPWGHGYPVCLFLFDGSSHRTKTIAGRPVKLRQLDD